MRFETQTFALPVQYNSKLVNKIIIEFMKMMVITPAIQGLDFESQ